MDTINKVDAAAMFLWDGGNTAEENSISVSTSKMNVSSQETLLQQSAIEQLSWKKIKMAKYGTTESVLTEWF